MFRTGRHVLTLVFIVTTAAGCASSPPARFFTLAAEGVAASSRAGPAEYAVIVGPVTIPELVDRPQLVVRSGANRVEIVEDARWAAPLEGEIARVTADLLGRLLPTAQITTSSGRGTLRPDYRVLIDVQRFETVPGEGATFEALWTVRPGIQSPVSGRTAVTEPASAGYEALVAAHSRALAEMSREIAAAIGRVRTAPPALGTETKQLPR